MMSSKLVGLAALTCLSLGALSGCAADTADNQEADDSTQDLTSAAKALIGSYSDDAGSFQKLVLSARTEGRRNAFSADVDTGVRCVRAPCPSSEHIEGTFTAGSKTVTLYSTTASVNSQHLLGTYNYVLQGGKLSLSKKGFDQSLSRDPAIWSASATKLVAKISGGFIAPPPAGSSCSNGVEYTLVRATRKLSWKRCDFAGASPRHWVTGSVTLSQAALDQLGTTVSGLEVTSGSICGADKPFETLTVSTPAGDKHYTDSFYSCRGGSDVYVDNIGDVFQALESASK
jgi:hypothetical protein